MKLKTAILITALTLIASQPAYSALNAYLNCESDGNHIDGGVTKPGRQGFIEIIGTSHTIVSPRDAASGLPTGKRSHQPFRFTKEIDKSTPILMKAMVDNATLTQFELTYWRISPVTQFEAPFYTISLENARIVGIQQEMLNTQYPENADHKEREHISLVYQNIEWTWHDGGIITQDHWDYEPGNLLISDLTGDGIVDMLDLALMANEWLSTIHP